MREGIGTCGQSDFRHNSYWLLNTMTLKPEGKGNQGGNRIITEMTESQSSDLGNCRTSKENIIVKNHPSVFERIFELKSARHHSFSAHICRCCLPQSDKVSRVSFFYAESVVPVKRGKKWQTICEFSTNQARS